MTIINQRRLMDRVAQLIADGYLFRGNVPNSIILTAKGLGVLLATAGRSIDKSKLKKESLKFERENTRKKADK